MKAIGPQKDVDKAVIIPVSNSIVVRKRFMFTPKFSAYLLPISIRFKGFAQVEHKYPMLSLANTYNEQDVQDWYESVKRGLEGEEFEVCCEMKYDGLSISLTYENGRLVRGVTRGDGVYGDDVTTNVKTIRCIPLVLNENVAYPEAFEIRGEILMPWSVFDDLNAKREAAEEPLFANPRNGLGRLTVQFRMCTAKQWRNTAAECGDTILGCTKDRKSVV